MARKDLDTEVSIRDTITEIGDGMEIQWTTERGESAVSAPRRRIVCATLIPHPRGKNPFPRNGH